MQAKTVQVVQMVEGRMVASEFAIENLEAWAEARGYRVTGHKPANSGRIVFREEIQGQPEFDQLAGPQYGGPGMVRYEDYASYNVLSA